MAGPTDQNSALAALTAALATPITEAELIAALAAGPIAYTAFVQGLIASIPPPPDTAGIDTIEPAAPQSKLTANFQAGGRFSTLAPGLTLVTVPLVLRRGTGLEGQGAQASRDVPSIANQEPFLVGSVIRAGANLSQVMGQYDPSHLQIGNALRDLTFDGGKGSYTVAAVVRLSPVGLQANNIQVSWGTGDGLYLASAGNYTPGGGGDPVHLNLVAQSSFYKLDGAGLITEASDGFVAFNEFAACGIGYRHTISGGNKVIGNQFDVCMQALIVEGDPYGAGTISAFLGNHYNGSTNDVLVRKNASRPAAEVAPTRHAFVGNIHSYCLGDAYQIGPQCSGGLIVGEQFSGVQGKDVNWTTFGQSNTGWVIVGTAHDKLPGDRFTNLPPDALVITGGPGGQFNRLTHLILSASTDASQKYLEILADGTLQHDRQSEFRGVSLEYELLVGTNNGIAATANRYTTAIVIDGSGLSVLNLLMPATTASNLTLRDGHIVEISFLVSIGSFSLIPNNNQTILGYTNGTAASPATPLRLRWIASRTTWIRA